MLANIRFVLCQTSHPGNIGATARAMKTMGLDDLRLVNPKQFPDHEATRRASGADDLLARAKVCASLPEALQGAVLTIGLTARRRDLAQEVLDVREAAQVLAEHARTQPVACVFGTEMSGLSNEELEQCHLLVTIPTNPVYSSLNVASAAQIVAYELKMQLDRQLPFVPEQQPLAAHEDVERFYRHLEEVLVGYRFLNPNAPRRLMLRLRRLFSRTRLEREEVNILRGILAALSRRD